MNQYTQLRNLDFHRECQRQLRRAVALGENVTESVIAHRAAQSAAPSYYLDFDYARKTMYHYRSHGSKSVISPTRQKMWQEINDRMEPYQRRGMNTSDAIQAVLTEGRASCYFMTPEYAARLYRDLKRRSRQRMIASHRRRPLNSDNQINTPSRI